MYYDSTNLTCGLVGAIVLLAGVIVENTFTGLMGICMIFGAAFPNFR